MLIVDGQNNAQKEPQKIIKVIALTADNRILLGVTRRLWVYDRYIYMYRYMYRYTQP